MKKKEEIKSAVALVYNEDIYNSPVVLSNGKGFIAKRMVEIAKKYKVPVVSDEESAEVLMKLNVGEEIPYSLYEAVSVILSHIYKLKKDKD